MSRVGTQDRGDVGRRRHTRAFVQPNRRRCPRHAWGGERAIRCPAVQGDDGRGGGTIPLTFFQQRFDAWFSEGGAGWQRQLMIDAPGDGARNSVIGFRT